MKKVVIDTNIIIDYLHLRLPEGEKVDFWKILSQPKIKPLISAATLQELFIGKSSKEKKREQKIRKALLLLRVIKIGEKIAELAGKILRNNPGKMSFPDAQIAATAILEKAQLATGNKKHFNNIKGLKFYA